MVLQKRDASAGIDDQHDIQRNIRFAAEVGDDLRLILENGEIVASEIRDETVVLAGDGEQHVHAFDADCQRWLPGS
jgi:hypothetical protein